VSAIILTFPVGGNCLDEAAISAIQTIAHCLNEQDDLEEGRHERSGTSDHIPLFDQYDRQLKRSNALIEGKTRIPVSQLELMEQLLLEEETMSAEDLELLIRGTLAQVPAGAAPATCPSCGWTYGSHASGCTGGAP
jgi:hypothetical protein